MGNCIICGKSVSDDRLTCRSHEEDVAFEFRGSRPEQLEPGRYYRGTVDGFADFGVFVDIGDHVTGLLHKSELDRRLESLDWDPGDAVYVQVREVHDNGNIDLGWSIRQSPREFRGTLVHDPEGDGPTVYRADTDEEESAPTTRTPSTPDRETELTRGGSASEDTDEEAAAERTGDGDESAAEDETTADETEDEATGGDEAAEAAAEDEATDEVAPEDVERVTVESLEDRIGDRVRLEGEIGDVRQTGGPTVFALADETGTVDCAAFEAAGVRAYPEVEVDDVVVIVGTVERHRGAVQVETEHLEELDEAESQRVHERLQAALDEQARPERADPLADDPAVDAVQDDLVDAATAIRRAVVDSRPVVVRHASTVDGYVAGAAIERAVLGLVRESHAAEDAEYHYVRRKPLGDDDPYYDMGSATNDVTGMLQDAARHGEKHPLFVLVGTGGTRESLDGIDLLGTYDAPRVVVDGDRIDEAVTEAVDVAVATPEVTASVLGATVAAYVNEDVRDDVAHLPAVSYWEDTPEAYVDLAADSAYDADDLSTLREAIALEAYYQSYSGKRELVEDLFWEADNRALAAHVAGQFRSKLEDELDTANPHVERHEVGDVRVDVLDAAAHTHRFEFPPTGVLLDALHRNARGETDGPLVTLCVDTDELHVRSTEALDVREVGERVAEACPEAGVRALGGTDGHVAYLSGEEKTVLTAAIEVVADLATDRVEASAGE